MSTPETTAPKTEANAASTAASKRKMSVRDIRTIVKHPIKSARKRNIWTLFGFTALVTSIYFYSIFRVGQEDFSDIDARGNPREKLRPL